MGGIMPGIPYVPGASSAENNNRTQGCPFAVMHRTIGKWPGDFSVGKNRTHSSPGTFQFLVGQDEDEWVQFYPADVRCTHAAGGNDGCGIEFSGQNGEPLTGWQLRAGKEIITFLTREFGVEKTLYDGPRKQIDDTSFRGYVNHLSILTSPQYQHFNYISQIEFLNMTNGTITPQWPDQGEEVFFIEVVRDTKPYKNLKEFPGGILLATGFTPDDMRFCYSGLPVLELAEGGVKKFFKGNRLTFRNHFGFDVEDADPRNKL